MRILVVLLLGGLIANSAMADKRWSWGDSSRWQKSEPTQKSEAQTSRSKASSSWNNYRSQLAPKAAKPKAKKTSRNRASRRMHELKWSNLNSGVCDELRGSGRGLRLMCMAFCELQSCQPDYAQEDPFQSCAKSSKWILARYDARRGAGDPVMPCLNQPDTQPTEPEPEAVVECPCWTSTELAGLRYTSADDSSAYCFQNATAAGSFTNFDSWLISGGAGATAYSTALSTTEFTDAEGSATCSLVDSHPEGSGPNVSRYMGITPAQFAACEIQLADSAAQRLASCTVMP